MDSSGQDIVEKRLAAPAMLRFSVFMLTIYPLAAQTGDAVLRTNCVACHNQQNRTSGLALDNRASALAGGARGPAVKPGAAADSLLIQAVEQKGDLKMPPGKRLPDEQIAILRAWIEQGFNWS